MLLKLLFRGAMLSNFKAREKESRKHHQLQPVQKQAKLSHLKPQQGSVEVLCGCFNLKGERKIIVEMILDGQQLQLRHHLSIIQKSDAQIITQLIIAYNLIRNFNRTAFAMYQHTPLFGTDLDQKQMACFGPENLFSLENEDFNTQHINRIPLDFQKEDYHIQFEEIFPGNNPPNISTVSISTRSNKSFDHFDRSEEFLLDGFGLNPADQEPAENVAKDLSEQKIQLSEGIVEEQQKIFERIPLKALCSQKESQLSKNCHDETKNIPKNYIKAIFTFILENSDYIQRLFGKANLSQENSSMARFLEYIRTEKRTKKYTIQRLKSLWLDQENGKAMRIISFEFLRKRSLGYIFGSKIQKKMHVIKHRSKFIKAVANPSTFTNIK